MSSASSRTKDIDRRANPAASRSRSARIKPDLLSDERVLLNLFDDAHVIAELDRRRKKGNGTDVWVGHIPGAPQSKVVLAERNGVVSGTVRWDGRLFEINYAGNGKHSIEEIDEALLPAHHNPLQVPEEALDFSAQDPSDPSNAPAPPSAAAGAVTIDLMVVYTEASRARYNPNDNGVDGIETRIESAVADANIGYVNSDVNIQLNLVHMGLINYDESTGSMLKSLNDLTGTSDGEADEVHAWRDDYGADMVSMITEDGSYCGIAWVMSTVSVGWSPYAFNVVRTTCLSNQTLAHELGHNQGNAHDRANAGVSGVFDYSYGHRNSGNWRTIMSYGGCSCPQIDHFSNPNVLYDAEATGIDHNQNPSNSADNARSMNNTAATVAAFREGSSVPEPVPQAPSSLVAGIVSDSEISLSWSDNADNETASEIHRSVNNGSWTHLATVGANVTDYNDDGLAPATTYKYRVRASNNSGNSGWSNTDSATTPTDLPFSDNIAEMDIPVTGIVSNSFTDTHGEDDVRETIAEVKTAGSRLVRYSHLDHRWRFTVNSNGAPTFHLNAHMSPSNYGESFLFSYSTDDVNYTEMLTVTNTTDDDSYQTFTLPSAVNGTVYVRVTDTDHVAGNNKRETIKIDHMYFRADDDGGGNEDPPLPPPPTPPTPPNAPTGLTAQAVSESRIDLSWKDKSDNELGFKIESSFDQSSWDQIASVSAGVKSYSDTGLDSGTTYHYRVKAYNEAGEAASNQASETTLSVSAIELTAIGLRSRKRVFLSWDGATTVNIDIYRDGDLVATTANDGGHIDSVSGNNTSIVYIVCEAGSSACSDPSTVTF